MKRVNGIFKARGNKGRFLALEAIHSRLNLLCDIRWRRRMLTREIPDVGPAYLEVLKLLTEYARCIYGHQLPKRALASLNEYCQSVERLAKLVSEDDVTVPRHIPGMVNSTYSHLCRHLDSLDASRECDSIFRQLGMASIVLFKHK